MKRIFLLVAALSSCSYYIAKVDEKHVTKASIEKKFSLLFSHNLSGETHPCGCRNFPLGGLPQVAGLFASIQKESDILYVDTGDTFFPSSVVPKTMTSSLTFAAENLGLGLEQVGLKYFVPGDQDFAMGLGFLQNMANIRKFDFLISNLIDENLIKHKRFAVVDRGQTKLFLIGLVDPEAMNGASAEYFLPVNESIKKVLKEITAAGYQQSNAYHRLIILSHSGMEADVELAKLNPNIDWIIGAHTQNFLRYSQDEGNVKIVQVLSKNHYIGEIKIDLNSKKQTDTYGILEVRDELEKNLNPNPIRSFIDQHKSKMNDLQIKEQSLMGINEGIYGYDLKKISHKNVKKYKTAGLCLECHKPQGDFWQSTSHAIAYTTLINVNEANNLSCVQCHTLGLNDPKGFTSNKDMVIFKKKPREKPFAKPLIDYWTEVKNLGAHVESVRKLAAPDRKKIAVEWLALDKKMQVKENFANVQCLNCHSQEDSHPKYTEPKKTSAERSGQIKNKCLVCHTPDESPEWYESGIKVNASFDEHYKNVSCPKL